MSTRRLSRHQDATRPAAPVRIVHLGAGNFFRAHQAWYTHAAPDAADWGIAAFTGRSATVADQLAGQDDLYQLCVQAPEGNQVEVIESLSAVHPAADLDAWLGYFADPQLAIVTSTITEHGYKRRADGSLNLEDDQIVEDLDYLANGEPEAVTSAPGKFVAGLQARAAADAGRLTFVPCDNVPDNGSMVRRIIGDFVTALGDDELRSWIEENVTYVTTMVDRITPRATDADRQAVAEETGADDPALVVTEPFSEWVLSGEFAQGRPAWEEPGARFVDDVALHERRKLWMLNGSHSLMAYAASILGHETVCDAINDPTVEGWVNQWWDAVGPHLGLPKAEIDDYRAALLERYRNPRIRHLLAQIAMDGSQKLPIRTVPGLKASLTDGQAPEGATRPVAAWIAHLRGHGAPISDAGADEPKRLASGELDEAVPRVLHWLELDEPAVTEQVVSQVREFEGV